MTKFYMIESSLNRKLSMNMMFDNVKSGKMAASRLIKILLNNLEHETAVDVLQDAYRFIIPASMNKYLHSEVNEERTAQVFYMTMKIMKSGRFNSTPAAMELLVSCAISFASSEEAAQLILGWYNTGNVTD